ncbi:DUF3800 domain-containing protein (plasmid) [Agrobacterium sp. rho-13.3]|uniref:DUF3800 domain-containing protein n=1 Tax=Agrobacterium sp. rho-13.3 TaxID=3072980 RepID=UPI0039B729F5
MRSAFSFLEDSLHLLYLDESGHSHDLSSDFFVLAGFSIFERQTHFARTPWNWAALSRPLQPSGIPNWQRRA